MKPRILISPDICYGTLAAGFGHSMVYSASSYYASRKFGNKEYYLIRQLVVCCNRNCCHACCIQD